MADRELPSSDSGSRVMSFRRGQSSVRAQSTPPSTVADLTKFESTEAPDDYRHRMVVNIVAFVFVLSLIGAGIWLANTMATMRKNQDCVLSGRRGCAPIEINKDRW